MRVAVLSDTHVDRLEHLPKKIIDALATADLVIHAGDFTELRLLEQLRGLKDIRAVQGNMDSPELKTLLPAREVVEIGGRWIGITHGSGAPWGIEKRIRKMFEGEPIDIIVYGHSHRAQNTVIDDILFFNPGRASDSFGILTIDEGARGEIISSR